MEMLKSFLFLQDISLVNSAQPASWNLRWYDTACLVTCQFAWVHQNSHFPPFWASVLTMFHTNNWNSHNPYRSILSVAFFFLTFHLFFFFHIYHQKIIFFVLNKQCLGNFLFFLLLFCLFPFFCNKEPPVVSGMKLRSQWWVPGWMWTW